MTTQLRYAAFSDVGLIRKNNQDGGYASPHMLVLADGMGGAAGGDIASSVTVAHLAANDDVHPAEDLLPLLPVPEKVALEGALRSLTDCDRILAQTALADAGGPPGAAALFAEADALRLAGDDRAILAYKRAWQAATR